MNEAPAMHRWQEKLNEGKHFEAILDTYFQGKDFLIEPVGLEEDKRGIDRWFTSPKTNSRFSVQYKADSRASETGNICIETVSVDAPNLKRGWIHTSQADYLAYFLPPENLIYLCRFSDVKARLPQWARTCKRGLAQNNGYVTVSILVPRAAFIPAVLHTFHLCRSTRAAQ